MLAVGVILGPYALNLLDPSILSVSADLREMARKRRASLAGRATEGDSLAAGTETHADRQPEPAGDCACNHKDS